MNKKVSQSAKALLANTIKSVDYVNRVHEERLMWDAKRQLDVTRQERKPRGRGPFHYRRDEATSSDRSSRDRERQAESDSSKGKNYYLKKLVEAEERDPTRWGHAGFKELYPEEFNDKRGAKDSSDESATRKSSSRSVSPDRSRRKRKRRRDSSSESLSSSTSSTSTSEEERRKRKKKKRRKHKHKKSKSKKSKQRRNHD